MYRKKIAIYVEGQTEQIFLNHLILVWWSYSGIRIKNIKLLGTCPLPNFNPDTESDIFILIINVDGVGSLASAIGNRANEQHNEGFVIIGLRDLFYREDWDNNLNPDEISQQIVNHFYKALKKINCKNPNKIDLFFAVMEIEAWLLAFTDAVSKWARVDEKRIQQIIDKESHNIEKIKNPSTLIEKIGKEAGKKSHKSYHGSKSIVNSITQEEIQKVYSSDKVPSFVKFWQNFLSLCEQFHEEKRLPIKCKISKNYTP